tara:strand:- start:78413 stop:78577 length:165 start_codon:yes stop_codon:yes gene_type:complete
MIQQQQHIYTKKKGHTTIFRFLPNTDILVRESEFIRMNRNDVIDEILKDDRNNK